MEVYEIVKTIGGGSFGQVYLAKHKREDKLYVIKRIKTRDMSQKDREQTENEVRLLQKLRHANIVAYKDSFIDREQFLNIVMIYCEGGDMYSKIKAQKGKNFSENQILDWMAQIILALHFLHEKKILHRDLKTQNIFLKNGTAQLSPSYTHTQLLFAPPIKHTTAEPRELSFLLAPAFWLRGSVCWVLSFLLLLRARAPRTLSHAPAKCCGTCCLRNYIFFLCVCACVFNGQAESGWVILASPRC